MHVTDCVRRNRATRAFTSESVTTDHIETILDAGRRAGSGKNRQPWAFVVVRESDRLDELASFGNYTTPLTEAPLAIVVVVETSAGGIPTTTAFDCGRAVQNMTLQATALELGSVPQRIDRDRANDALDVPAGNTVCIALAVGHPADSVDTIEGRERDAVLDRTGRRPIAEVVHWETYRG